jgi:hypothetical protein
MAAKKGKAKKVPAVGDFVYHRVLGICHAFHPPIVV